MKYLIERPDTNEWYKEAPLIRTHTFGKGWDHNGYKWTRNANYATQFDSFEQAEKYIELYGIRFDDNFWTIDGEKVIVTEHEFVLTGQ